MTEIADIEFGVKVYDGLSGTRIEPKPTLATAEDYVGYLARINNTRGTYGVRGELIHRAGSGGEWTRLTPEDAQQIKDEAWAGLDAAMEPIIAAGVAQLAEQCQRNSAPYSSEADRG